MRHEVSFYEPDTPPSQKLVWLTDLHLDAAEKPFNQQFFADVKGFNPDAVLIGGDISNGVNSLFQVIKLAQYIGKPFYFVLGNHDFYYGSISEIRRMAENASARHLFAHYLTACDVVELTPKTALIGHDGWSDARAGSFENSNILLNDYFLIHELRRLSTSKLKEKLHQLGDEAADALKPRLKKALQQYSRVIVLTHPPPFVEACLYDGHHADENWSPHFVCQAVGDVLKKEMESRPEKQMLVLCGHSHHAADTRILPNLRVLTGHSSLGEPSVQGVIFC